MTRLRALLLTATVGAVVLSVPAGASPATVERDDRDLCVYVVQHGQPKGYCVRF